MTKKEAIIIAYYLATAVQEYEVNIIPEDLALLKKNPHFSAAYDDYMDQIDEEEKVDIRYVELMVEEYGENWMLLNEKSWPSKLIRDAMIAQARREVLN